MGSHVPRLAMMSPLFCTVLFTGACLPQKKKNDHPAGAAAPTATAKLTDCASAWKQMVASSPANLVLDYEIEVKSVIGAAKPVTTIEQQTIKESVKESGESRIIREMITTKTVGVDGKPVSPPEPKSEIVTLTQLDYVTACEQNKSILQQHGASFIDFSTVIDSGEESVTVKAGEFKTKYIKGKDGTKSSSGGTTSVLFVEVWRLTEPTRSYDIKRIQTGTISGVSGTPSKTVVTTKQLAAHKP